MDIPFTRPTLPPYALVNKEVEAFYATGMITNGPVVRQLEAEIQDTLRVDNAVAVSCCTSGLMVTLKCSGLCGRVVLPSFTFFATVHAVVWNGLEPVFIDIDPDTWNISLEALETALEEDEAISAVLPVHVFGNPCDVDRLENLARGHDVAVVYDSAHAMGARVGDRFVGRFGDAEVFSLSPTKIVVAGEGGIVTTSDDRMARQLRASRDYGNTGDYNPAFIGLNARMSEFHAALATASFRMLEKNVTKRNAIADRYVEGLSSLPGITQQAIWEGNRSTFKDFTVRIDEAKFGMSRDALSWHLARNGIDSRKYYFPPVHQTKAYWEKWGRHCDEYLPETNRLSKQALSLPIWSHIGLDLVDRVVENLHGAYESAEEIKNEYLKENS
jgi:dTDP-4-amino-4,6-dideoxygalactose transaminase